MIVYLTELTVRCYFLDILLVRGESSLNVYEIECRLQDSQTRNTTGSHAVFGHCKDVFKFMSRVIILINVFRPQKKTLKKTRIKLCNTLAIPILLYGNETWTVTARDGRRITAAEMKYMRRTAGYTGDRLQNKCVLHLNQCTSDGGLSHRLTFRHRASSI